MDLSQQVSDRITLDAWIAIAAYPWNTCPIVQQVDVADGQEGDGLMLAVEADGKPSMWVTVGADGSQRISLKADELIPRFRWTRLTGVVDARGEQLHAAALRRRPQGRRDAGRGGPTRPGPDAPLRLAQGVKRMPYRPVGKGQYPTQYSFEGLIDEVGVLTRALTDAQIEQSGAAFAMTEERRTNPDMIRRVLPAGRKDLERLRRPLHPPAVPRGLEQDVPRLRPPGHRRQLRQDALPLSSSGTASATSRCWSARTAAGTATSSTRTGGRAAASRCPTRRWSSAACTSSSRAPPAWCSSGATRSPRSATGSPTRIPNRAGATGRPGTSIYPDGTDGQADAGLHGRKPTARVAGVDGDHGARAAAGNGRSTPPRP